jgi:hypothetical protein
MSTLLSAAENRSSIARSRHFETRPSDHRFFNIMSVVTSLTIAS